MSDSLNEGYGQREVEAADPLHRVDPLDRDASNRDKQQREDLSNPNARAHRKQAPRKDQVFISEEARRAFEETARATADSARTEEGA